MDPRKYLDAATRIVQDDGAEGVAIIMADHERLLQALSAIYTLTAPAGEKDIDTRMAEARAKALAGLRLPADLKERLRVAGRPASTEGEFDAELESIEREADELRRYRDVVRGILQVIREQGTAAVPDLIVAEVRRIFPTLSPTVEADGAATEERAEDAAMRLARALEASEEARGVAESRVAALEEGAATLIGALTEFGETPWWLRAANAMNELHRLAVEKDGV
jgi:hypothetical protein